jgi:drug/metabolite transporter (DMT)-like permease
MNYKANPFFQNNLFGIAMMLMHAVALSILYAVVKELTKELNSNMVVFLYKFSLFVSVIPWCIWRGLKDLKTNRIWLHVFRGFLSVCGSLSMFYAIKHIGLSDVTAVAYLEQIILLIIGILYFKESATKTKFFVIIASFIGAILIIKPDYVLWLSNTIMGKHYELNTNINSHYIFVFLAIGFWSLNSTVIKILGKTEKTKVQLFYVMLFSSIIAFPIAFMNWETVYHVTGALEIKYPNSFIDFGNLGIETTHIGLIAFIALCYFLHVIGHFKALKHAELSVVIPFEYSRLVFAGILGYIFFAEIPLTPSYFGYALIIGAGLILFKSERKKMKKKRAEETRNQQIREIESEFDQS